MAAPTFYWPVVTFLLRHGHQAAEPHRSAFVCRVLSFADLDGYPRRAEFAAAFTKTGSESARFLEAGHLARAGYLRLEDYEYALVRATSS